MQQLTVKTKSATEIPSSLQHRIDTLHAKFHAKFHHFPTHFVRAPGRVNVIGEHVDYSGYAVLPIAIEQDILIALSTSSRLIAADGTNRKLLPVVEIANADGNNYSSCEFEAGKNPPLDNRRHLWSNYVVCGYMGLLQDEKADIRDDLVGMNLMVDGTVPAGSGLSSSSALVCASVLATAVAHKRVSFFTPAELAEIAIKCERFVGIESGGMDQAISFLAKKGVAQLISFDPLSARDVELPSGISLVVAHTMVTANKYVGSDTNYNLRVVECRLAAVLLAKSQDYKDYKSIRTLSAFQKQCGVNLTLKQCYEIAEKCLPDGAVEKKDLPSLLGVSSIEEVDQLFGRSTVIANNSLFKLKNRALHVYSESIRVEEFQRESDPVVLGRLMNESHYSNRDLFDVSCPELEELTTLCRKHGALGSRLTGAGWGGCTVSLLLTEHVTTFISHIWARYYEGNAERSSQLKPQEQLLFATLPSEGAYIIAL